MPFFTTNYISRRTVENITSKTTVVSTEIPYKDLLYIHIPKTGGTSIEAYLSKRYCTPLSPASLFGNAPTTRLVSTPYQDTSVFTGFTGIPMLRAPIKPFDRSVSLQHHTYHTLYCYRDAVKITLTPRTRILASVRNPYSRLISDMFMSGIISAKDTPADVFAKLPAYLSSATDNHSIPQHEFVVNEFGVVLKQLVVVRTETLQADMVRAGYPDFSGHLNRGMPRDYMSYLNADAIELVNAHYRRDFELFGYDMV